MTKKNTNALKSRKVFICIPSGHLTMAESAYSQALWMIQNEVNQFRFFISNRVDANRSLCLHNQRMLNLDMIMLDSDVIPSQPLDIILNYIEEDRKLGCHIIVAPLWSPTQRWIIDPPPKDDKPYEVNGGSLGFVYIPADIANAITPVSFYGFFGSKEGTPLYFRYTETSSEDSDFIMRMKYQGFKVCADPRIRVTHHKYIPLSGPSPINMLKDMLEKSGIQALLSNNTILIPLDIDLHLVLADAREENGKIRVGLIQITAGQKIITLDAAKLVTADELKEMINKYSKATEKLKSLPPDAIVIGDEVIYEKGQKREKLFSNS